MHRAVLTIVTAATVFLHTVIGCGACRFCESSSATISSTSTAQTPVRRDCTVGHRHHCCSKRTPVAPSMSERNVDLDVSKSETCECDSRQGHRPLFPCGHGECSFRVVKFLSSAGTAMPDTMGAWSTIDVLLEPDVEELRLSSARGIRHHPPRLRSHLALRILLI